MKTLLLLLVCLAPAIASAQPGPLRFRGVSIGMSRAEVRATGDTLDVFADTAYGLPATITYRFKGDALTYIIVDYSRGVSATKASVASALADFDSVHARIAAVMGYPGGEAGKWRLGCTGDSLVDRIAAGCQSIAYRWTPDRIPTADVEQSIDAFDGVINHRVLFDPLGPTGVESGDAHPSALDLR